MQTPVIFKEYKKICVLYQKQVWKHKPIGHRVYGQTQEDIAGRFLKAGQAASCVCRVLMMVVTFLYSPYRKINIINLVNRLPVFLSTRSRLSLVTNLSLFSSYSIRDSANHLFRSKGKYIPFNNAPQVLVYFAIQQGCVAKIPQATVIRKNEESNIELYN